MPAKYFSGLELKPHSSILGAGWPAFPTGFRVSEATEAAYMSVDARLATKGFVRRPEAKLQGFSVR